MAPVIELVDLASCSFRAMGTDVHVLVVDGCDADLHWARAEVDRLESLWSRFLPDSDISRVNRAAGTPVEVTPATIALVKRAEQAWRATGGAFDPLLGASLAALGYDRTFDQVRTHSAGTLTGQATPAAAARRPRIDAVHGTIEIPPGTALDLGGIAKGWTADLVAGALLRRGAAGACVNVGGDLAVAGRAPHPAGWIVEVEHEAARSETARLVALRTGGMATSTILRRAWQGPGGDQRHHLLDPRTHRPAGGDLAEVTVLAPSATDAEVLTKVAFAAPDRLDAALAASGAAAICATRSGHSNDTGHTTAWLQDDFLEARDAG